MGKDPNATINIDSFSAQSQAFNEHLDYNEILNQSNNTEATDKPNNVVDSSREENENVEPQIKPVDKQNSDQNISSQISASSNEDVRTKSKNLTAKENNSNQMASDAALSNNVKHTLGRETQDSIEASEGIKNENYNNLLPQDVSFPNQDSILVEPLSEMGQPEETLDDINNISSRMLHTKKPTNSVGNTLFKIFGIAIPLLLMGLMGYRLCISMKRTNQVGPGKFGSLFGSTKGDVDPKMIHQIPTVNISDRLVYGSPYEQSSCNDKIERT